MHRSPCALVLCLVLALLGACASQNGGQEISEERAIEIGRQQIDFEPGKVEAVKETDQGRPVWRVTFYGKGVDAAHPGQVSFFLIDRKTGEIVSLGMS
jgi:uncharacterized membrane protein YkoI